MLPLRLKHARLFNFSKVSEWATKAAAARRAAAPQAWRAGCFLSACSSGADDANSPALDDLVIHYLRFAQRIAETFPSLSSKCRFVALTGKQRRHLRGLGHSLQAIVQLGKDGVTDSVIAALDQALDDHELVKVRIGANALVERGEVGDILASKTRSDLAQVLGNTLLFYRKHPEEPQIRLP